MELITTGYFLAVLVGTSLGLIGSGGSILTVPIMVYILGIEPILATTYSLFVVGITSLLGGIKNASQKNVHLKAVLIFGIPSIFSVFVTRAIVVPYIPEILFQIGNFKFTKNIALMVLFAVVMISASVSMIRPCENCDNEETSQIKYNFPLLFLIGISVGALTGLVGAGGGFLIIPALVLLAKMPMRISIGTSLFIIAINSLLGFLGGISHAEEFDWKFLLIFTTLSVIGILIGLFLSKKIKGSRLKTSFGWFVLVMGMYILIKELFLK